MSQWKEKVKYEDGTESKEEDSGKSKKTIAEKDGKGSLYTVGSSLSLPIEKNGEMFTEDVAGDIPHTRVEITKPKSVTYVVNEGFIIKAEDPNKTTFEDEYYGN